MVMSAPSVEVDGEVMPPAREEDVGGGTGTTLVTVVEARSEVQLLATPPLEEAAHTVLFDEPVPFQ